MTSTLKSIAPMLAVQDVAATAAYYRDSLGFEISFVAESETLPGYAAVSRDGCELHFLGDPGRDPSDVRSGMNVAVSDVDLLYAEFRERGAFDDEFPRHLDAIREHPPEDKTYGMRDIIFVDPNGYILVFGHPV